MLWHVNRTPRRPQEGAGMRRQWGRGAGGWENPAGAGCVQRGNSADPVREGKGRKWGTEAANAYRVLPGVRHVGAVDEART